MVAFHGNPALKSQAITRIQEHLVWGQIIQAHYWNGTCGCYLGCLSHRAKRTHEEVEKLWALPIVFSYLVESIFEEMPQKLAPQFAVDAVKAIPVGADLSGVVTSHLLWMINDSRNGIGNMQKLSDETRDLAKRLEEIISAPEANSLKLIEIENDAYNSAVTLASKLEPTQVHKKGSWPRAPRTTPGTAWTFTEGSESDCCACFVLSKIAKVVFDDSRLMTLKRDAQELDEYTSHSFDRVEWSADSIQDGAFVDCWTTEDRDSEQPYWEQVREAEHSCGSTLLTAFKWAVRNEIVEIEEQANHLIAELQLLPAAIAPVE